MIGKFKQAGSAGNWLAVALLLALGAVALTDAVAQQAKGPSAAEKKTNRDRFLKKVILPFGRGTVVVSEGDFEPRSLGSYSVRLYGTETPEFPYDNFLSGCLRPRENGCIEDLLVRDIDGDGAQDVVVVIRCVGTGQFLSAEAFGFNNKQVKLIASVGDLDRNADVTKALRLKLLNSFTPGRAEWFGAVEAIVQVGDDAGHGPDIGSKEWMSAVNVKVFGDAADKSVAVGSKEWFSLLNRVLGNYNAKPVPPVASGTLTLEGFGAIRFGDTIPTVLEKLKALKATASDLSGQTIDAKWWAKIKKAQEEQGPCAAYITISCYPAVAFVVDDEKIVRADITRAGIGDQLKIEIGMTVDQVKRLCPAARFETDKYAEEGEDLKNAFIPSPDSKGGWRITEKDGKVAEIRAGLKPAIEWVENG